MDAADGRPKGFQWKHLAGGILGVILGLGVLGYAPVMPCPACHVAKNSGAYVDLVHYQACSHRVSAFKWLWIKMDLGR